MRAQHFRANVGIALLDEAGRVLVLERSDVPGAWQLPQGGIDVGEEPEDAALRELREETGVDATTVLPLGVHGEWIAYEWPRELQRNGRRGQVQRWYAFRATAATHVDLAASEEFVAARWVPVAEAVALAAPMRRAVYERIAPWLEALGAAAP